MQHRFMTYQCCHQTCIIAYESLSFTVNLLDLVKSQADSDNHHSFQYIFYVIDNVTNLRYCLVFM